MALESGGIRDAVVIEELPRLIYRVEFDDQTRALAHVGSHQDKDFLRLLPGDRVKVKLSPTDRGRGRIVERYRP